MIRTAFKVASSYAGEGLMTAKRDSKSKPKSKRPKLNKETLKDLEPKAGENVKAGQAGQLNDSEKVTCTCNCH